MAATEDQHLHRVRLDNLVAERGLVASRARARDAILRGHVTVDGRVVTKPSLNVEPTCAIVLDDPAAAFVSRSGLKLDAALAAFAVAPAGRTALDLGASTGGFTDSLLKHGAAHVVAVDVGHGQLHPRIAGDARVTAIEGLNARDLREDDLAGHGFDLLVADVSFISLRLALPPALDLAEPGADAILLVKPQFEAGREAIAKNGLLRDPGSAEGVAEGVMTWLGEQRGWTALGLLPSPIEGGDGQKEFLLHGRKA